MRKVQLSASGLMVMLLLAMPRDAHADPGEDLDDDLDGVHRTSSIASPVDRFPGTFDAGSLDEGQWSADVLPVPELHYGLTKELTVGVGGMTLATATGRPTASVDLRYRVWGEGRWASTLTLGGSYGGGSMVLRRFEAAMTIEHRASSRRSLALTVYGGGLRIGIAKDAMSTVTGSVEGAVVMLSHLHFPASWFGYQLSLGWMPHLTGKFDYPGGSTELDASKLIPLAARVMLMFKAGPRWMISLGVPALPIPLPYLGVQRAW